MSVYCASCEFVHPDSRKPDAPWQWRCMRVPVRPGYGYVSPDFSPSPPYARCIDVNGGDCTMFEPRREAPVKEVA